MTGTNRLILVLETPDVRLRDDCRLERVWIAADRFERFVRELGKDNPAFNKVLDYNVVSTLRSIPRDVAHDMPVRIIAATALYLSLPPGTRDRRLRSAGNQTIW
jgi:hypothetical protein